MKNNSLPGDLQLDEYVEVVHEIYREHDAQRSIWDVWSHTSHHASAIAEEIRKGADAEDLQRDIADFSLWLFTTLKRLTGSVGEAKENESLQDSLIRVSSKASHLLWNRYPGICPGCYWHRTVQGTREMTTSERATPCNCLLRAPERHRTKAERNEHRRNQRLRALALRKFAAETRNNMPAGIDGWQEMFATIYMGTLRNLTITEVGLRFMEEIGEVSDALIRMYSYTETDFKLGEPSWRQLRLEDELADIFSWLFGLIVKLDLLCKTATPFITTIASQVSLNWNLKLSSILWKRYGSSELNSFHCPHCRQAHCSCKILFVPNMRGVEALRAHRLTLDQLAKTIEQVF